MTFDLADHPHRRRNPLTGEWVLVSPHRAKRPWHGDASRPEATIAVEHDATCHLCPGNRRVSGAVNPSYEGPFLFTNDHAAMRPDSPAPEGRDPLFAVERARGEARVLCFSPHHGRTLPELDESQVRAVVEAWCAQSANLGSDYAHVQIFENKGAMMGCSSPHPHGQIWASDFIPTEVATEDRCQKAWLETHGTVLLDALSDRETGGPRVVEDDEDWIAVVPWWASWPFETLLVARHPVVRLEELAPAARDGLARVIRRLTARYDNLFGTRFPYSMGWHGAPHGLADPTGWRLHAHFYPPLLRSATVRKYMVGFEMLGEAQRDFTPEQAAAQLRAVSPDRMSVA